MIYSIERPVIRLSLSFGHIRPVHMPGRWIQDPTQVCKGQGTRYKPGGCCATIRLGRMIGEHWGAKSRGKKRPDTTLLQRINLL